VNVGAQTTILVIALLVLTDSSAIDAASSGRLDFAAASKEAERVAKMSEAHAYMIKFTDAMDKTIARATTCLQRSKETVRYEFVFVISATGHIDEVFASTQNQLTACALRQLKSGKVPPPPRGPWYQAIVLVYQVTPKPGPPDTPKALKTNQVGEYERAIAPYVKQGRATYPAARTRFLRGLPPDHVFSVWVRFYSNDKERFEDAFVRVESIKREMLHGTIANEMKVVTERRRNERVVIPESEVKDWLILRPDGTEEGNHVGKFLDYYKPK